MNELQKHEIASLIRKMELFELAMKQTGNDGFANIVREWREQLEGVEKWEL